MKFRRRQRTQLLPKDLLNDLERAESVKDRIKEQLKNKPDQPAMRDQYVGMDFGTYASSAMNFMTSAPPSFGPMDYQQEMALQQQRMAAESDRSRLEALTGLGESLESLGGLGAVFPLLGGGSRRR